MEKNIKKRVCGVAWGLITVLVVVFGYWFFLSPHGYWQKQKEADREEYSERRLLWRKSETMTMQRMLQDLTQLADGDSLMVCRITNITLSDYRALIHGTAQPKRLAWAKMRYWYMTCIANGREWMQEDANERKCKSMVFRSSFHCDLQTDTTKDFHKEQITTTETTYNEMYPRLGKPADNEFETWRDKKNKRWVKL